MRLEVVGDKALVAALLAKADPDDSTRSAVRDGSLLIERAVKLQLSHSSHARGTPTPSAPGSPPSLVSGSLRRSVRAGVPYSFGGGWAADTSPDTVYAAIHEFGGVTGRNHATRLPARPYVRPGMATARPGLRAIFRAHWSAHWS